MKRLIVFLTILLALSCGQAYALTQISLDSVGNRLGSPTADTIKAGDTVKFYIRYTNLSDSGFNVTNAFILSSPDGATWTDSCPGNFRGSNLGPIGMDTTGLLSKALFPTVYQLRTFSTPTGSPVRADGISPDTISFSGAGNDIGLGLPAQTDVRHFVIRIRPKVADIGKTICLDSSMKFPPTNVWKWSMLYGGNTGDFSTPLWSGRACFVIGPVGTGVNVIPGDGLPKEFALMQNYPNPFNPATQINFELPVKSEVSLKIYNLLGQEVATLVNEEKAAGRYSADWNASALASGVYFYKLEAGSFVQTKKMILMK